MFSFFDEIDKQDSIKRCFIREERKKRIRAQAIANRRRLEGYYYMVGVLP